MAFSQQQRRSTGNGSAQNAHSPEEGMWNKKQKVESPQEPLRHSLSLSLRDCVSSGLCPSWGSDSSLLFCRMVFAALSAQGKGGLGQVLSREWSELLNPQERSDWPSWGGCEYSFISEGNVDLCLTSVVSASWIQCSIVYRVFSWKINYFNFHYKLGVDITSALIIHTRELRFRGIR